MERLGPYTLEGELARGGMGVVWRAHHPRLGHVALKLLSPAGGDVEKQRKRFLREAEAARLLEHPQLVRVLDAGELRGRLYMALELVEGESLAQRLSRDGPLRPAQAARLVASLADAVHYAHSEGVLHRDIKPSNVLLDAQGAPRLTDFGLVRRLDGGLSGTQLTEEGSFLGTPAFWSPEQAQGQLDRFGPATDVYGLGATLFAALTGRSPQGGATLLEILAAFDGPPPSPQVDPRLDRIVQRALARQPDARYASAAALAADLRTWREGPTATSAARGHAAAWIAGGLLGVGGLAAVAIVAVGSGPAGESAASSPAPSAQPPSTPSAAPPSTPSAAPPSTPSPLEPRAEAEESWLALVMEAQALEDADQLSAALATYDEALGLAPEQADLYRARGELLRRLGDLDGALRDLDRAIDLDPRRPLAYFVRASIRDARGDLPGAVADYDQAIALAPEDPRAYHNRGALYAELGRPEDSLRDLLRAAELGSKSAATFEAIGNHFILAGDVARALPAFQRATELAPQDAVLWLHLGRALDRSGQPDRALDAIERSLSLEDRLAATWHYRGQLFFDARNWPEAEASFSRALDLEPEQASTWFCRGATRERGGDARGAASDYARTLELDPGHAQARERLQGLR